MRSRTSRSAKSSASRPNNCDSARLSFAVTYMAQCYFSRAADTIGGTWPREPVLPEQPKCRILSTSALARDRRENKHKPVEELPMITAIVRFKLPENFDAAKTA